MTDRVIRDLIEFDVNQLATFHNNPRRGDVDAIARSLQKNGQYKPITVNVGTITGRPFEVLAGNHTLLAARDIGWPTLMGTTVDVDDLTAARIVAVDNHSADLGTYDNDALIALLEQISAGDDENLGDLEGTAYSNRDLDRLLAEQRRRLDPNPDLDDLPDDVAPTAELGDVYDLGPHRVICGSATDPDAYDLLLQGHRVHVMWTDPPYGVNYVGGTKDHLTIRNDTAFGLRALLDDWLAAAVPHLAPGAPWYVAHAETERRTFEGALRDAGMVVRQTLIWVKDSLVLGHSDYHYRHEPILQGTAPAGDPVMGPFQLHRPRIAWSRASSDPQAHPEPRHEPILYGFAPTTGGLGKLGRGGDRWLGDNAQTTVFEIPKPTRSAEHPTMKPVQLIVDQLTNSAPLGGVVLDTFGGSGSTLMAAEHLGLSARIIELDPRYVDVICARWQMATGGTPMLGSRPVDFLR